ncbi:hypothetical protein NMY22_g10795 [Coprinellus aureogranulatus]|nr:hypothetical protein NMY22_g10795 [Coprinellus aureogranulatus]
MQVRLPIHTQSLLAKSQCGIAGRPAPAVIAGFAAVNTGITAGTFFGLREFIVGPVLAASSREDASVRRVEDLRTEKLLDSGISGAITGGLIRGWRSGPKAVLPGAAMASLGCVALQYGYNRVTMSRLQYISEHPDASNPTPPHPSEESTFRQKMLKVFGVSQISEEEYLEKLKQQREKYEKRIRDLEELQRREEEARKK